MSSDLNLFQGSPVSMGRNFFPGYPFEISVCGEKSKNLFALDRLCIAHIRKGSAVLSDGTRTISVIAPACLTLNDKEKFTIIEENDLALTLLFFHPKTINYNLTLNNLDTWDPDVPDNINQDRFYVKIFIERDSGFKGHIQLGFESDKRIGEYLIKLDRELKLQDSVSWPCRSRTFLFELLFYLIQIYREPSASLSVLSAKDQFSDRVIRYLGCHYHEKITIPDLCRRFETNRNTLSERFVSETGRSVISYLTDLRISMACMMLRDSELDIEEIGYRVGFNDTTHFRRVFKKNTKLSPREYRDRFLQK